MARAATAPARIERGPAAAGNGLLIGVGLGMAFLFFMWMLGAAKAGPLFNEANMLYVALMFYGGAAALYIGFGVTGVERHVRVASVLTALGFVANTLAAGHRWYISGHPPFSNLYEMLLSFVWTVAVLTLFAERKFGVRIIGSITMPLAVVSVLLMQLLPSEVRPLVPALQSTWLHIHVTLAMLAYAACALSFAVAMMFLIQDGVKTETFLATTSAFTTAIYIGMLTRFERWGGLSVAAWDLENKHEISLSRGVQLMVTIPELGWIMLAAMIVCVVPLLLYLAPKSRRWRVGIRETWEEELAREYGSAFTRALGHALIGIVVGLLWARFAVLRPPLALIDATITAGKNDEEAAALASHVFTIALVVQILALTAFVLRVRSGMYGSLDADGLFATSLAASPFLLSGLIIGVFASLLYLMLLWRRTDLERLLPTAEALDRITYKTIGIGFPLLTLMIAAGAYWANRAWGSYWSWDPKETWAAITWGVYALYLHARITHGWRGRRAAYLAIIGFGVVMFTFFGVTYLLAGMHSYGS